MIISLLHAVNSNAADKLNKFREGCGQGKMRLKNQKITIIHKNLHNPPMDGAVDTVDTCTEASSLALEGALGTLAFLLWLCLCPKCINGLHQQQNI